ncbi:hypothetical protein ACPSM1_19710 [Micromonospora chersina]|uniref:hypothetical protein n=1 Tax=Micromonospora chersina TaxID=47854 RepID=UPI003C9F8CDF
MIQEAGRGRRPRGFAQYGVYTGSQDWTQDALHENDEIFDRKASESGTTHSVYDAYYTASTARRAPE